MNIKIVNNYFRFHVPYLGFVANRSGRVINHCRRILNILEEILANSRSKAHFVALILTKMIISELKKIFLQQSIGLL
jgi:hypothetical protein